MDGSTTPSDLNNACGRQNLDSVSEGGRARVIEVDEPGATGERLLEMGLTPGTVVHVVKRGAWGAPLQLAVRGFLLSLRREQARRIRVVPLSCP